MNLKSECVGVFPTTGRPQKDPLGRLTTEYNLTSLINTLLDVDGFVITNDIQGFDSNSNSTFQFNIKGYIFTIYNLSKLLGKVSDANNLYASIKIQIKTGNSDTSTGNENLNRIQSIVGADNLDGDYEGLNISSTEPKDTPYFLHILEKRFVDTSTTDKQYKWYIPEESKIKLKTNASGNRSISIDDGVLE